MNILYLHGLKSKLNKEKREVLEKYGEAFAPEIDYSGEMSYLSVSLKATLTQNSRSS